jgi:transcriptional regulator with XRE-family HTH domain
MAHEKYRKFMGNALRQVAYWRQVAVRDFTEDFISRFRGKMSQAELAARLKVKPAYISRILRGSDNFTLETMVKLALAVGGKVRVHIADLNAETRFSDYRTAGNIIDVPLSGEVIPGVSLALRAPASETRNFGAAAHG